MATKTHKQVAERFKLQLAELCEQYDITIISASPIQVEIEPVYDKEAALYKEYGAVFDIGQRFDKTSADKIRELIEKSDWPSHTR